MRSCHIWGSRYHGWQPIQRSLCHYLSYLRRLSRHFRRGEFELWARRGPRSLRTLALHEGVRHGPACGQALRRSRQPSSVHLASHLSLTCRPAPLYWIARSPSTRTPAPFRAVHLLPRCLVARPVHHRAPLPLLHPPPLGEDLLPVAWTRSRSPLLRREGIVRRPGSVRLRDPPGALYAATVDRITLPEDNQWPATHNAFSATATRVRYALIMSPLDDSAGHDELPNRQERTVTSSGRAPVGVTCDLPEHAQVRHSTGELAKKSCMDAAQVNSNGLAAESQLRAFWYVASDDAQGP